jgi:hypothetical protein
MMTTHIDTYAREGFFNNFLLLPVHKSKGSKVVTHFIAIQKDISVVKKVPPGLVIRLTRRPYGD